MVGPRYERVIVTEDRRKARGTSGRSNGFPVLVGRQKRNHATAV